MIHIPFKGLLSPWTVGSVKQQGGGRLDWLICTLDGEAPAKQWSGVTPLQGHLHLNGQCPDPEAEREALGSGEYVLSGEVVELWGLERGG